MRISALETGSISGLLAAYILLTSRGLAGIGPIPYTVCWCAGAWALLVAILVRTRRLRLGDLLRVEVIAAIGLTSWLELASRPLRDLDIYLSAGRNFLLGAPVYLASPMTVLPSDAGQLPFLYPPVTLPLFAVLALGGIVGIGAWVVASAGAAAAGLRALGLSPWWTALFFLWPPIFSGLWAGNVAAVTFGLFALGPWRADALVASTVFKLYNAVTLLWVVRERRRRRQLRRAIAWAATVVAGATLIVGVERWGEWWAGLVNFQRSQEALPELKGIAVSAFVPPIVFIAIAGVLIVGAMLARGREGLGRLGVSSLTASPSLFSPGFVFALPGMLGLRAPWLWLALGITAGPVQGSAWWVAVAVVVAGWMLPGLRRGDQSDDEPHPLSSRPWPAAPERIR